MSLVIPVSKKRASRSAKQLAVQEAFARAARECSAQLAHLKGTAEFQVAYRECIKRKMLPTGDSPGRG